AFRNFVSNNSLIDLGFQGDPFTWSNGQQGNNEIKQRLDRALSCQNWRTYFDKALVFHEERIGSDHCPLLIHLQGKWIRKKCLFCFDIKWLQDPQSVEIITRNWNELPRESSHFLNNCTTDLGKWAKQNFKDSMEREKEIRSRITDIQMLHRTPTIIEEEQSLQQELEDIWTTKEIEWSQKSRINWLKVGDKNTSFFHTSAIFRR
ncbi:hypothetical protein LINPERHAP2_LOCUS24804, partial [Linum perenne]